MWEKANPLEGNQKQTEIDTLAERSMARTNYPISKVFLGGTLSSEKYRVNQRVGEILVFQPLEGRDTTFHPRVLRVENGQGKYVRWIGHLLRHSLEFFMESAILKSNQSISPRCKGSSNDRSSLDCLCRSLQRNLTRDIKEKI